MKNVPLTASSRDEVFPQLPPEIRHMHVDQIGQAVFILVKQVLIDLSSRNHFSAMQRQKLEQ
jgi:hypothetical protein